MLVLCVVVLFVCVVVCLFVHLGIYLWCVLGLRDLMFMVCLVAFVRVFALLICVRVCVWLRRLLYWCVVVCVCVDVLLHRLIVDVFVCLIDVLRVRLCACVFVCVFV